MRVKLVFSPPRKELHRSDMELLSVRDVLSVGELHGSPHGAGETLIRASWARRPHQLQAGADHVTHDCETKIKKPQPILTCEKCWLDQYHFLQPKGTNSLPVKFQKAPAYNRYR